MYGQAGYTLVTNKASKGFTVCLQKIFCTKAV